MYKKNVKLKLLIIILACIFIVSIMLYLFYQNLERSSYVEFMSGKRVYVTLAETSLEWQKGLMYAKEMQNDSGMFFIFNDDSVLNFWMKNTYIPLDIIYIDKDFKIINIIDNALPCTTEPCISYSSEIPARYVLEVNSNYCKENNIKINDKIFFQRRN